MLKKIKNSYLHALLPIQLRTLSTFEQDILDFPQDVHLILDYSLRDGIT